jgi:hypothetical protein
VQQSQLILQGMQRQQQGHHIGLASTQCTIRQCMGGCYKAQLSRGRFFVSDTLSLTIPRGGGEGPGGVGLRHALHNHQKPHKTKPTLPQGGCRTPGGQRQFGSSESSPLGRRAFSGWSCLTGCVITKETLP